MDATESETARPVPALVKQTPVSLAVSVEECDTASKDIPIYVLALVCSINTATKAA